MGFNKIYIDATTIIRAWKYNGAQGIADLYIKYDGIIMSDSVAARIGNIMDKEVSLEDKKKTLEVFITMMLEGLVKIK